MAGDPFKLQHDVSHLKGAIINRYQPEWSVASPATLPQGVSWLNRGVGKKQLVIFTIINLLLGLLIITRLIQLQVIKGEHYFSLSEGNRIRTVIIPAPRGLIKDSFNKLLVQNQPSFALYLISAQLPSNDDEKYEVLNKVGRLLSVESQSKLLTIASHNSYVPELITEGLNHEAAIELMVNQVNLPGVEVMAEAVRQSPDDYNLSSVVGYVRKISAEELQQYKNQGYRFTDRIGKAGLEKFYEDKLRGTNGEENFQVDAHGHLVSLAGRKTPVVGQTLQLYLDYDLQKVLANSLKHWAGSHGAAAVALDPTTGGVLAMVSLPSFNINLFSSSTSGETITQLLNDPRQPLFNRVISGQYPSGSTIKPLLAAAALQTGIITPQTTVMSTGGLSIGQWFFPDWKAGGHGVTNVEKAIAESVNTFFYTIGGGWGNITGLGPDRLAMWLSKFGWGKKLGIDLPGEVAGLVPTPAWKEQRGTEPWYIGDTYHESIGQGDILVTPLQVAAATASVANGGTLYQPHLVKAIIKDTNVTNVNPVVLAENLADRANLAVVRNGMRLTVTSGSAQRLNSLSVAVAGKTGTAEVAKGQPHAWFSGFAPFDNPKIVLAIIIENGGEGSVMAVPVAEEVWRWWAANRT